MGKTRLLSKTTHEPEREAVVQTIQLSFLFSDSQITVAVIFSYLFCFWDSKHSPFIAEEKK